MTQERLTIDDSSDEPKGSDISTGENQKIEDIAADEKETLLKFSFSERAKKFSRVSILLTSLIVGGFGAYKAYETVESRNNVEVAGQVYTKDDLEKLRKTLEKSKLGESSSFSYNDAELVFDNAEKFLQKDWGREFILILLELKPHEAYSKVGKFLKYFSDADGEALLEKMTSQVSVEYPLYYYKYYKNFPYFEKILRASIGKAGNEALLKYAYSYKDLPEASEIFNKAANSVDVERQSDLIKYYSSYKDYTRAETFLKKSLEGRTKTRFNSVLLESASSFIDIEWTHDYIRKAAFDFPEGALIYFQKYKKLKDANSILQTAVDTFAVKGDRILIEFFDNFKHLPNSEKALIKSVEKMFSSNDNDKSFLLLRGKNLLQFQWLNQYITNAVISSPEYVSQHFGDIYQSFKIPGIEKAIHDSLALVLERNSKHIIKNPELRNVPWLSDILRQAIEKDPLEALKVDQIFDAFADSERFMKRVFQDAIKTSPRSLLKYISEEAANKEWAVAAIKEASSFYPEEFIDNAYNFDIKIYGTQIKLAAHAAHKNRSFQQIIGSAAALVRLDDKSIDSLIIDSINSDPKSGLSFYLAHENKQEEDEGYYKKIYSKKIRGQIIHQLIERDPKFLLDNYQKMRNMDSSAEALKRLVFRSAAKAPESIVLNFKKNWEDLPYMPEVFEKVFLNDPVSIGKHLEFQSETSTGAIIMKLLRKSSQPQIIKFIDALDEISLSKKINENLYIKYITNLDRIALIYSSQSDTKLNEALKLATSKDFLQFLIELKSSEQKIGSIGIEKLMSKVALEEVRKINDLHERPDTERFKSVEKMRASELYTLMVYGEEEIFTSTFNGFFSRMIEKMKASHLKGDELLKNSGFNKFRTLIKMASSFNRLQEFLSTMDSADSKEILRKFIRLDEKEDFLNQAVAIADTFNSIQDPVILMALSSEIKSEYKRVNEIKNKKATTVYGLLAGLFAQKKTIDDDWIIEMSQKYKLPNLLEVNRADLFDQYGSNVQEYFFYDDDDGKASFESFLSQYQGKNEWKIEDKNEFVIIASNARDGKKIEIFANKPNHQHDGSEKINEYFKSKKIFPSVIVHRGHSYHANDSIQRVAAGARIVSLGSCGGYNNITAVLEKSPNAHIISTKGVGTMTINDPLFFALNEEIRNSGKINWPIFWSQMEKKLSGNKVFNDYVSPHRNLGVVFLKAYNKNLQNE
ncbi:MAG: hypothetical protein UT12_C0032G0006 [Candidatus Curtissbacteria bacterium GW2011_GWC2_38_9]|uniref:Uncharacterized protein n=1 Tax=Candidatus Curtissbacteria bacterium GW2011_GWC2_38_9 TaxID=1618414 RepID=A0A0G0LA59_9BACT|nr:MAG: hypothetical protein UT12_C0032G0006 [Candidatus Curtissbacteria bacterium GW2011_GWC2_38_9]